MARGQSFLNYTGVMRGGIVPGFYKSRYTIIVQNHPQRREGEGYFLESENVSSRSTKKEGSANIASIRNSMEDINVESIF